MVYTDGVHLVADRLPELFAYANKVSLGEEMVRVGGKNVHPHFFICGHVRQRVLADVEVKQVSTKEIVRLSKLNYRQPESEQEKEEWEKHHKQSIDDMQMPSENDFQRMFNNIKKRMGL